MSETPDVLKKRMKLKVEFDSVDPFVLSYIFQKDKIESFVTTIKINDYIQVQVGQLKFEETIAPQTYEIFIIISAHILIPLGVNLISNWLYDKLRNKTNQVVIDRMTVELEKEKIKRVLIEKIKINWLKNEFFKSCIIIPRIQVGKMQIIETLIKEEDYY